MGEISAFYNVLENSVMCIGIFRKIALLEISQNGQVAKLLKTNF